MLRDKLRFFVSRISPPLLELRTGNKRCGFLPCKSLEGTYGSVKIILEPKIKCIVYNKPKNDTKKHIKFVVNQRKTNNNLSDKIASARVIASRCHGNYQNPNEFRAVSEHFQKLI